MLITSNAPRLTVRQIKNHLGRKEWSIARELNLGALGHEGRLRGEKVTGAGKVGQGGQWQVALEAYLQWLGIPEEDRQFLGDDGLPELHRFSVVAANEKITPTQLIQFVEGNGLTHLQVGQDRYFTHLQRIHFQTLLRAKTAA